MSTEEQITPPPPPEDLEIPVGQRADGTTPDPEDEEQRPETDEVEQTPGDEDEAETFDREYVQRLRDEAAQHRVAAREAREALEPLQQRLFTAEVAATGRLADPTDLPFDAALLEDQTALAGAIEDLLARKPHLASRRTRGSIGQGGGSGRPEQVNLAAMLSSRA